MESEVRNYIIEQAIFFLAKAGEFYPFGVVIAMDGSLVPLGVQLENDQPQPQEVIEVLENAIIEKLKSEDAKLGGIGTDVNYKSVGGAEKKSAVQIRILQANGESIDYYLPYRREEEKFIYEDIISEKGTLNFLKIV